MRVIIPEPKLKSDAHRYSERLCYTDKLIIRQFKDSYGICVEDINLGINTFKRRLFYFFNLNFLMIYNNSSDNYSIGMNKHLLYKKVKHLAIPACSGTK